MGSETLAAASLWREDHIALAPAMVQLYLKANLLSRSTASVLLWGEAGVGKKYLAEYIQKRGPRARAPFVRVNCNAISSELFASELFGYAPNAFTGASPKGKVGLLEAAHRGTVLLDEINELSAENQVLLLHFLQNRTITPVGSLRSREIDARIICTSGRDLREMIDEGSFRLDLYYRICVANLFVPPLRERREEIPAFLTYFIDRFLASEQPGVARPEIPADRLEELVRRDWPGNLREVENFACRLCLLEEPSPAAWSGAGQPGGGLGSGETAAPAEDRSRVQTLKEAMRAFEREYIQAAIRETPTLRAAADRLGISFSSLCRKRAELGIGREHAKTCEKKPPA